jgi:hypothetical protein
MHSYAISSKIDERHKAYLAARRKCNIFAD